MPFVIKGLELIGQEKTWQWLTGDVICCGLILFGLYVDYTIFIDFGFSEALFDPMNWLVFKFWINKAYTKVGSAGFGLLAARWYLRINQYKKSDQYRK